ncbi:MAG: hypothetical protein MUP13_14280, partial [Thermoanaerobaculales bacterium]|nr:hypothetical protein [Thermoanaerobaculales bacterium]
MPEPRKEWMFWAQTSSKGALTGNAAWRIGMFTQEDLWKCESQKIRRMREYDNNLLRFDTLHALRVLTSII